MQKLLSPKGIVSLLIGLALIAFLFSRCSSDEAQIRRQLHALEAALDMPAKEQLVVSITAANRISEFFTEDPTLDLGHPLDEITSRSQLKSIMAHARQQATMLDVNIHGMEIKKGADKSTALVGLMLEGKIQAARESANEFREYDLVLKKVSGEWLIDRAKQVVSIDNPSQ